MNSYTEPLFKELNERLAADAELARLNLGALARPSVRLAAQRVPFARIAMGESRIGGTPDLPAGFEWPRWKPSKPHNDKYARPWRPDSPAPLGFIAQIDLSDVPRVDDTLPEAGWLYFFYDRYSEPWGFDPSDRGSCHIVYVDAQTELNRCDPPSDAEDDHRAELCRVEAWPELTLPDDLPEISYGTLAYEAYHELCDELSKAGGKIIFHRLLGHPQIIQNPMELECQLASNGVNCGDPGGYQSKDAAILKPGAADWRLLLQIDTDEDGPGWMWGDVGRIYFWVKQQDLASLRFDDAWLIFQCC